MTLTIRALTGEALEAALPDVAALRITVFKDFPYLYDGDLAYEEAYLQAYRETDRALLVGAFDGARLVGASTAAPLADHADDFRAAFEGSGHALGDYFYCAESVLLPAYRRQGVGHRFFDLREAYGRDLGFTKCCFCAVIRPEARTFRPSRSSRLLISALQNTTCGG